MSINKITSEDQLSHSKDLIQENIDQLKKLFPEIVSEGKIDFKSLQQVLGEEIEDEEEFYRFTWAGKSQARREAHKPSTGTLRPSKEESLDWDSTQNLYIEGDNLEVLKLLQKSYSGKIKMIYIDPPYNTGNDFVYKDNYKDNLKNYQEITGQIDSEGNKFSTNSDSDGRYHSNWLNMMYPRLRLARNLLTQDGVIFISIDDNENNNLSKLCDEIFGENNFQGMFVWKTRQASGKQVAINNVSIEHEYILCYGRSNNVKFLGVDRNKESYKNPDNDPRGDWAKHPLDVGSTREERPNCFYTLIDPNTGIKYEANPNRVWAFAPSSMKKLIEEDKILFHPEGKTKPYLKKFWTDLQSTTKPISTWLSRKDFNIGYNTEGTKITNDLFEGKKMFDYPKPVTLLKLLINQKTKDGDIILDFFSGSSTTAHSILELNISDQKKRKFIQVQLPEKTDENSISFKDGFKTISDIGKERIRRVLKKIKKVNPEKSKEMDLGFKVFKLDSSNIKSWDGNPENLKSSLFDSVSNIKSDRTEEDVLYEILLKYGLDLTLPIEERDIHGKKVFNVGMGSLFICLGDEITSKVAEGIGEWKDECDPEVCRVIFKDNGFTDVEKTNSVQILKRFGINEIRSI